MSSAEKSLKTINDLIDRWNLVDELHQENLATKKAVHDALSGDRWAKGERMIATFSKEGTAFDHFKPPVDDITE